MGETFLLQLQMERSTMVPLVLIRWKLESGPLNAALAVRRSPLLWEFYQAV